LAAILSAVALVTLAVLHVSRNHAETLAAGEQLMQRTNVLFSKSLRRTFEVVDAVATDARDAYVGYQGRGVAAVADPYQYLRSLLAISPVIRGVAWIDADGNRVFASVSSQLAALSVANQPQFRVHRDDPGAGVYVGTPFRSVLDGSWQLIVSRRVNNAQGQFAGTVQVALSTSHFDEIFQQLEDSSGLLLALFRRDGACLLFSGPNEACFGNRLEQGELARVVRGAPGAGAFRGTNSLKGGDALDRLGAYTHLAGFDLVATNSVAVDLLLARWRANALVELGFALFAALAILAIGWRTAHAVAREAVVAEQLRAASLAAKAAEAEALAANRAKSMFLSHMSHELRTPLNAVLGFSDMLMSVGFERLGAARSLEYVRDIHRSGAHLLDLVNDVLDLSRIESGALQLAIKAHDPTRLVDNALEIVDPIAKARRVEIERHVESVEHVMCDRRAMQQCLLNLLSNAIKFSDAGGAVGVSVTRVSRAARFIVSDSGPGIPADVLANIGQPFNQAINPLVSGQEGTGLGLAITLKLVEAQGGRLTIDSAPGHGTRVTIDLPIDSGVSESRAA